MLDLSLEKLQPYDNKIITEKEKINYLNSVYDEKVLKDHKIKYIEELEQKLSLFKDVIPMTYKNNEIQDLFRDINTIDVIPDSIYIENEANISKLLDIIVNKMSTIKEKYEAKRELLKLTVPVYRIRENENEIVVKGERIGIYKVPGNYSSELGFERKKEDEDRFI